MKNTSSTNITILGAAIILAGAMIFLGVSLRSNGFSGSGSGMSFEEQLRAYQQKQEEEQRKVQEEQANQRAQKAKNVDPISQDDHVLGPQDAPITIFEYSDFECPFCKRFAQTPAEIIKDNPGKVNTVYRHFPLSFHDPLATKQAIASECAAAQGGSDAFYAYHDEIFKRTNSNGRGMKESELVAIAKDLGLDTKKFVACQTSGTFDQHVKDDIASGTKAGVTGTPGVIIKNNETGEVRVMPGAVPVESVQSAVDELLQEK